MAKKRFFKHDGGVAAVEFAFVLPVMLTFLFGLIEVSQGLTCRANVTFLASTGSDLIAQESQVTNADMTNVFNALSAMLYPFSATSVQITISSIVDNGTSTSGKVAWSDTKNGTARTVNSTYTFPTNAQGVITANGGGSVILTEVSYSYASPISKYFVKDITMTNYFFSKPRRVAKITRVAS
jgi:Flp pilus assembly protein TadG